MLARDSSSRAATWSGSSYAIDSACRTPRRPSSASAVVSGRRLIVMHGSRSCVIVSIPPEATTCSGTPSVSSGSTTAACGIIASNRMLFL